MPGRVIAIGDVHGCAAALENLLDAVDPQPGDQLITLGDVIDRGPDSRGVVQLLLETASNCQVTPILGNHEEMLLAVVHGRIPPEDWLGHGGMETLASYGFVGNLKVIPLAHLDFLGSGRPYIEIATHFFVHANFLPNLPLAEQPDDVLRWTSLDDFFPGRHMSGKVAVVGHTAEKSGEILSLPHLKCIDTYCYGGGWLTALDVGTGQVWQANQRGESRRN